jgi:hypothetical protein
MAIDTRDKLIASIAAAIRKDFYKASGTAEGAGTWHSLWALNGYPILGVTPPAYNAGAGYVPSRVTGGAIPFANPSAGVLTYLLQAMIAGSVIGKLILYDRLWHCSGLTTNNANPTTLTITTPGSLTRPDALGADVEIWGEVWGAPGATGSAWSVTYVDQADADKTATYTHPANAESVGQMFPFLLDATTTGVKQAKSFTHTVATGTAGSIGITLLRRIAEIPIQIANVGDIFDAFFLGMPRIYDDACLAAMVMCSTTSTGIIQGSFLLGQG